MGGVTFPCDAKLPDLFVDVGGVYGQGEGGRYQVAEVDDDDGKSLFPALVGMGGVDMVVAVCFGGAQPLDGPPQIWGDIFFKSQFVAINGENQSLGIAEHV